MLNSDQIKALMNMSPNLSYQDYSQIGTITPVSLEVTSRQATLNIGTIGHVSHGKSTVVRAISSVNVGLKDGQTQGGKAEEHHHQTGLRQRKNLQMSQVSVTPKLPIVRQSQRRQSALQTLLFSHGTLATRVFR